MLQDIRKKRGLSQSQLAQKSGVNVRRLQNYEQGHRDINGAKISILLDLAIALECDLNDILSNNEVIHKYERFKSVEYNKN